MSRTKGAGARGERPPLVLTWCSSRKRGAGAVIELAGPSRPQQSIESDWLGALRAASPLGEAGRLYAGRAIFIAREGARIAGADLSIVSAGLGWVTSRTNIPNYNLTPARNALAAKVVGPFDARSWWNAVSAGPFSASPAEDLAGRPMVLACISQEYAPFFAVELERVPLGRLRIFGAGIARSLPATLRPAVMPYDTRLSSFAGGTRADFAQRALSHYLTKRGIAGNLDDDRSFVLREMAALPTPAPMRLGEHRNDDAIRALIMELLPTMGKRRTPMLQHLRFERGIACEQGRFARLFAEVIAQ